MCKQSRYGYHGVMCWGSELCFVPGAIDRRMLSEGGPRAEDRWQLGQDKVEMSGGLLGGTNLERLVCRTVAVAECYLVLKVQRDPVHVVSLGTYLCIQDSRIQTANSLLNVQSCCKELHIKSLYFVVSWINKILVEIETSFVAWEIKTWALDFQCLACGREIRGV